MNKSFIGKNITDLMYLFVHEWVATMAKADVARKDGNYDQIRDTITLSSPTSSGGNFINHKGYEILVEAAQLLLQEEGLQERVSRETAIKILSNAFFGRRDKLREHGKKFSIHALIGDAKRELAAIQWANGDYIFPAIFASKAQSSNFTCGPIRIVSKQVLLEEYCQKIEEERKRIDARGSIDFLVEWENYIRRYDHFVIVKLKGFERAVAWDTATTAAEFLLNLIRMVFTYQHTYRIKLAGGHIWEEMTASIMFADSGGTAFEWSPGSKGSHLDDSWTKTVDDQLGGAAGYLSSLAHLLISGRHPNSPILERMRYANQLISEAYCEPHDHIRLVRLVAALEALAVLENGEKSHQLAMRCASAGGWSDTKHACKIFDAVADAYRWRNAIVHGSTAPVERVKIAFLVLEQYLVHIYEGFVMIYAGIWNAKKPQSISALRREVRQRIEQFFWNQELAISDGLT